MNEQDICNVITKCCNEYIRSSTSFVRDSSDSNADDTNHTTSKSSSESFSSSSSKILAIDKSNVTIRTVCQLWAGMGHIYQITLLENFLKKQSMQCIQNTVPFSEMPQNWIIKHIVLPSQSQRQSSIGDCRKARSYVVEANFYKYIAPMIIHQQHLHIPKPYHIELRFFHQNQATAKYKNMQTYDKKNRNQMKHKRSTRSDDDNDDSKDHDGEIEQQLFPNEIIIGMSYINVCNNSKNRYADHSNDPIVIQAVLRWLASFHSMFWGTNQSQQIVTTYGLQPLGTYWYLDTRLEEYNKMPNARTYCECCRQNNNSTHNNNKAITKGNNKHDHCTCWESRLKRAARPINDYVHDRDVYQCIVHGDTKEDNILLLPQQSHNQKSHDTSASSSSFSLQQQREVALCDFQYCGKGTPASDLVYYFTSSVSNEICTTSIDLYIDYYLEQLQQCLILAEQQQQKQHQTVLPVSSIRNSSILTKEQFNKSIDMAYCDYYRFMCGWGCYWGSSVEYGKNRVCTILNKLDNEFYHQTTTSTGTIGRQDDKGVSLLLSEKDYDVVIRKVYG